MYNKYILLYQQDRLYIPLQIFRRNSIYSCTIVCPYRVTSVFQSPNLINSSYLDNRKTWQLCEYTRNPLLCFTTFWGVTCLTIKLHLNLFFMQCTKTILIHEYYVMILDAYVDHTYVICFRH
ncbi:hypothetical protein Hdeb2414_s0005g00166391 [Helianthus debilis subsp. tardiflorus]